MNRLRYTTSPVPGDLAIFRSNLGLGRARHRQAGTVEGMVPGETCATICFVDRDGLPRELTVDFDELDFYTERPESKVKVGDVFVVKHNDHGVYSGLWGKVGIVVGESSKLTADALPCWSVFIPSAERGLKEPLLVPEESLVLQSLTPKEISE